MSLARAEMADFSDGGALARSSSAPVSSGTAPMPPGGVFFVATARQADACAELRARRYVIVSTPAAPPAEGALRRVIEDAVEGALALRGALPPGAPDSADADAVVRDQVLRARALGAAGVALALPPLPGREGTGRTLSLDDSAVVAAWVAAAQRGAVVVLLDERDRDAHVLAPRRLGELASSMKAQLRAPRVAPLAPAPAARDSVPPSSGEVERVVEPIPVTVKEGAVERAGLTLVSAAAAPAGGPEEEDPPTQRYRERPPPPIMAMPRRGVMKRRPRFEVTVGDEAPAEGPAVAREEAPAAPEKPLAESAAPAAIAPLAAAEKAPAAIAPLAAAEKAPAVTERAPAAIEVPAVGEVPSPAARALSAEAPLPEAPLPEAPAPEAPARLTRTPVNALRKRPRLAPPVAKPAAQAEPAAAPAAEEPAPAAEVIDDELPPPPEPKGAARRIVNAAEWRAHAVELDKARGPKPVSVIDKLFTTRYMPLLGAHARGEVDSTMKGVIDAFRTNFEHSYREAFSALRVTGKRPPMVFDAPEIAARIGRLNGARAVKLLLVDALRFDIGERVAHRLGDRLTGRAVCVERSLLWSALPTTTSTQMTLLARGPEALRDGEPRTEPEAEIVRGRAVGTVRRERVGAREVMKLDLVEARLRTAGPAYEDRIDSLAEEVAQITVRFIETLPPRTLLFMFGDHGFRLPSTPDGRTTGAATQGGVSPEEVLVPAHAWLIGGVH